MVYEMGDAARRVRALPRRAPAHRRRRRPRPAPPGADPAGQLRRQRRGVRRRRRAASASCPSSCARRPATSGCGARSTASRSCRMTRRGSRSTATRPTTSRCPGSSSGCAPSAAATRRGCRRSSSASRAASTRPTRSSSRPRPATGSACRARTSSASRCRGSRRAPGRRRTRSTSWSRSASPGRSSTSARRPGRCSTDLGHPFGRGEEVYDVTFENVQAGLRTDYLFRAANQRGGIVLGTGDLSELALGLVHVRRRRPDVALRGQHRRAEDVDAAPHPLGRVVGPVRGPGQRHPARDPRPPRSAPSWCRPGRARGSSRPRTRSAPTRCRTSRSSTCCAGATGRARSPSSPSTRGPTPARGAWPAGYPEGARPTYDLATIRRWMEVFVQALLRQPVQALGHPQRPEGRRRAARCRRAATGGCRPTPPRAPGSPSSTPTSPRTEHRLRRGRCLVAHIRPPAPPSSPSGRRLAGEPGRHRADDRRPPRLRTSEAIR